MNISGRRLFWMGVLLFSCLASANAQRMPQDNWYYGTKFGSAGSGDGQFNGAWGVAVGTNDYLFVADTGNHRIQVFTRDGTFVRKWGGGGSGNGQFSSPRAIAIGTNQLVYVADLSNNRIQVFDQQGVYLRQWACPTPVGVAINRQNGLVHVADNANRQVKVFADDGAGTLVREWGETGSMPGKFEDIRGVAVGLGGRVYVADSRALQVFDKEGRYIQEILPPGYFAGSTGFYCVSTTEDGLVLASQDYDSQRNNPVMLSTVYAFYVLDQDLSILMMIERTSINAVAGAPGGTLYLAHYEHAIHPLRRTFRSLQDTVIPLPSILSVSQRPGTTFVDIDYEIADADTPNLAVGVLAFSGGINSLNSLLRLETFVEGTATNLGASVTANEPHRLTWNAAADWSVDYGEAKIRILATDSPDLLDHLFIHMPSDGTNSALSIARDPVTQYDMLHCWFWLVATNDTGVSLSSGSLYGVGGAHDGQLLASGTTTTPEGRAFLFERMGLREATSAELTRMRHGTSGVVNQWDPRNTVGPGIHPRKINEWGFDTGDWGSDGWWIVKP
ncbi:MAG: NHL repeat-containing protein [Kiritimatiellae bacterium]|nr:NHL repeat-containing protein [Kiritimatiellia bacterium]